jgi:hypothetical protein
MNPETITLSIISLKGKCGTTISSFLCLERAHSQRINPTQDEPAITKVMIDAAEFHVNLRAAPWKSMKTRSTEPASIRRPPSQSSLLRRGDAALKLWKPLGQTRRTTIIGMNAAGPLLYH